MIQYHDFVQCTGLHSSLNTHKSYFLNIMTRNDYSTITALTALLFVLLPLFTKKNITFLKLINILSF